MANSTGATQNQRLEQAAKDTLDAARRLTSQPNAPRMEDLANWDGNPTDGQAAVYSKATGLWGPATSGGGIQGDRIFLQNNALVVPTGSGDVDLSTFTVAYSVGTSITVGSVPVPSLVISTAGVYALLTMVDWPVYNATTFGATSLYTNIYTPGGYSAGNIIDVRAPINSAAVSKTTVTLSGVRYFASSGTGQDIILTLGQNSGVSVTLNSVILEVIRLS